MKKVIGIGNALVDVLVRIPDEGILSEHQLPRGSMQLVDRQFSDRLLAVTGHLKPETASGGSAANTINGLAMLGTPCAYIGKVGRDHFGQLFREHMERNQVRSLMLESETDTGRCLSLISPDSERTMATYLGAAIDLRPEELSPEMFSGYEILHAEGYLVQNHELIEAALNMAKQKGLMISLDLASYNVVQENLAFIRHILEHYVDLVLANEEEARAFSGMEPGKALDELSKICRIAVVKTGSRGSLVGSGAGRHSIAPIIATAVDTTGAGDLYAAGFLYGLATDRPLEVCGHYGSLMAGKVIEVIGARLDDRHLKEVRSMIASGMPGTFQSL